MLIYLDNCMFNRPFDDQSALRVRIETEAKLHIQDLIKQQELRLVWSYILAYENAQNPFFERRFAIEQWAQLAYICLYQSDEVLQIAKDLALKGIRTKDALHAACAIVAKAEYFLTTDDKLLNKLAGDKRIIAINPTDFIKVLDNDN